MTLLDHATAWHTAGYTPVPITPDGQKRPIGKWAHLQHQQPTLDQVRAAFTNTDTDGIGLICGGPMNLAMLEVEGRALHYATRINEVLTDHNLGNLWDRIRTGYVETSPSGGIHWYYRITDGPAARNTKLARNTNREVLIETRGQGGFTVIAPSAGRTHTTGKAWSVLVGTPDTVATITTDEQDALLAIIATLDETPVIEDTPHIPSFGTGTKGTRPGDDYNARATWDDIIGARGWTKTKHFGGNTIGWTRPGKNPGDGISATTGRNDGDNLYVFSSSTEFDTEKPYSKFAAYVLLEHQGDWSAAAKQLAKDGYGTPPPISPPATHHAPTGTDGTQPSPQLASPDKILRDHGATEDGTAQAFVRLYQHKLRYCPQRGSWLVWTGARWSWDDSEEHREYVRDTARLLPEGEGWAAHKKRALTAAGVSGITRLARTDKSITIHIDQLDANPYELNTPGGIINLRTGKLRPADPAALHTRTTAVAPDFDAPSPVFDRFLQTTFGGDTELEHFMQRLLGLSLIGTVLEQVLPFAFGPGANGKTTLFEAVADIIGTGEEGYAASIPAETIMVRRFSEHPAELAQLAGVRVAIASELEDGARFAEARIKQLTGRDRINARFMRRDPFTFRPSHSLFLLGNHQPQATAGGPAFWRRILLLPFAHVVPEGERDSMLGEKLIAEGPAILAWLAQGAADYLQHGLGTPAAVREATAAYAHDQDTVARFIEDRCTVAPAERVAVKDIRAAYEQWCVELGETPVSAKRFSLDMSREGCEGYRSHGVRYLRGVDLTPVETGTPDDDGYDEPGDAW